MNILLITPSWNPNGIASGLTFSIKPIVDRLLKSGNSCTILTIGSRDTNNTSNLNVVSINDKLAKYIRGFSLITICYLLKNRSIIRGFDLIHLYSYSNLFVLSAIISLDILKIKAPIVFTPHYHGVANSKIETIILKMYNLLGKSIFEKSDRIICDCNYEAAILKRDFNLCDEKLSVIALGVNVTPCNGMLKLKKDSDQVSLLYVGRLVKHKGVQYIPKCMSILKEKYNLDPILDIVGPGGPFEKDIKRLAKNLKLDKDIIWSGYLSTNDLEKKYKIVDIFILLSWAEAYGLVVADALAMGVPCIVTNISGLSEFVNEPGCFGIEFPPDPEKLASLIFKVHRSDIVVGPFSERKIRTWDVVAEDYIDIYKQLL